MRLGLLYGFSDSHESLDTVLEAERLGYDSVWTGEAWGSDTIVPLAWIGEQMMCLSSSLSIGFTVNFPEEPDTVLENVREIGPHVMFAPPRIWENMVSSVQVRIRRTTPSRQTRATSSSRSECSAFASCRAGLATTR